MPSIQILLFATRQDLEPGIRLIEGQCFLKYAPCGLFPSPDISLHRSMFELNSLGTAAGGNQTSCDEFLVLNGDVALKVRDVPQRAGGTKYAVDQVLNPSSICFRPGGAYGGKCLICGRIGTASDYPEALELFRKFSRSITGGFKKQKGYYVGPNALSFSRSGGRLITMHVDERPEYDLTVP